MEQKIKDKVVYFTAILSMCVILVCVAYFFFLRTVEIDVTENINLIYQGENGGASLEVETNSDDLNQRVKEFFDTVTYEVSPNAQLSNGDVVTITASYDAELAYRYHYEIQGTSREIVVEGLPNRYDALDQIDPDYLQDVLEAGQKYIEDHQEEILDLDPQAQEDTESHLIDAQPCFAAFLKSKDSSASDRVIQIIRMDHVQGEQNYTFYYLVCVPEINDGEEIQTQDIFGERAYLSQQEIQAQDFIGYVQRVFGNQYQVEMISLETDDSIQNEETE